MKIQFDISKRPQIESGEYKVETRDGKPARIACWDLKGNDDFFILALVEKNQKEVSYCYPATGCCKAACDPEGKDDLFIITPEPELTDWEKFISGCLQKHGLLDCGASDRIAKNCSAELLELAKNEILRSDKWIIGNDALRLTYERGKAEALKDLPRWKKDKSFETEGTFMGVKGREYFIVKDGYSISVAELIEKLPGFKED